MASKYERAFSWTEQAVDVLRRLWCEEGMTANHVANILSVQFSGSLSRNSVIGKVNRLGLKQKEKAFKRKRLLVKKTRAIAKSPKAIAAALAPALNQLPAISDQIAIEPAIIIEPDNSTLIGLFDLTETTCRFPIGDPREEGFGYCGAPSPFGGSPYCAFHHALAYVPQQPASKRRNTDPHGMRRIQINAF